MGIPPYLLASRLNLKIKGRTAQKSASSSQGKSLIFVCTGGPWLQCSKGRRKQNSSCRSLHSTLCSRAVGIVKPSENEAVNAGGKPTVKPVKNIAFPLDAFVWIICLCLSRLAALCISRMLGKAPAHKAARAPTQTMTALLQLPVCLHHNDTGFAASFPKSRKTANP